MSKTVKVFQYFSIGIQLHIFLDLNSVRHEYVSWLGIIYYLSTYYILYLKYFRLNYK